MEELILFINDVSNWSCVFHHKSLVFVILICSPSPHQMFFFHIYTAHFMILRSEASTKYIQYKKNFNYFYYSLASNIKKWSKKSLNKFHWVQAIGVIKWFSFQSVAWRVAQASAITWVSGTRSPLTLPWNV